MQDTRQKGLFAFWHRSLSELSHLRSIVGAGLLAALGMVIKSFSIPIGSISRISFTFLANAMAGYLYGPFAAGLTAAVVDILGFLLQPASGPFFPGFTISAFVSGFIYGCWLYDAPVRLWRVAGACATNTLVISLGLNPLWLYLLYGDAWVGLLVARLPLNLIQLPINITLLYLLLRVLEKQKHRLVSPKAQ